jgi:hypothetical protein
MSKSEDSSWATLTMETASSSDSPVTTHHSTPINIPEELTLHKHRRENSRCLKLEMLRGADGTAREHLQRYCILQNVPELGRRIFSYSKSCHDNTNVFHAYSSGWPTVFGATRVAFVWVIPRNVCEKWIQALQLKKKLQRVSQWTPKCKEN